MPRINLTIRLDATPLRRVRVQKLFFGVPAGDFVTDDAGVVRDDKGDQGIDAEFGTVDIRIICQNSVVKVLDGNFPLFPAQVHTDVSQLADQAVVDVGAQLNHFRVLRQFIDAYDLVFRRFEPFASLPDPDFPLGRQDSLAETFDQARRLEVSFPDQFPTQLSFVEPKSVATGFPLVHIKDNDARLFGTGPPATLVPSELSHALHFGLLDQDRRELVQNDYLGFIINDVANGGFGTHCVSKQTTPLVAFVEALDHFSHRFNEFMLAVRSGTLAGNRVSRLVPGIDPQLAALLDTVAPPVGPTLPGPVEPGEQDLDALTKAFTSYESSPSRVFGNQVAERDRRGTITPRTPTFLPGAPGGCPAPPGGLNNNGSSIEGAIYGALFVDFAREVGLDFVVGTFISSRALSVGEYTEHIRQEFPREFRLLEAASGRWQL